MPRTIAITVSDEWDKATAMGGHTPEGDIEDLQTQAVAQGRQAQIQALIAAASQLDPAAQDALIAQVAASLKAALPKEEQATPSVAPISVK